MRGFDGTGAAASIHSASDNGFTVSGVFRDQADFAVIVLHDADDFWEHYTFKYLPDFDFTGIVLGFDLTYQGLQPIDSQKYNWIDWATLDVIQQSGTTVQIPLFKNAALKSGFYTAATTAVTITAPGGIVDYDRVTLWYQNIAFDYVVYSGTSGSTTTAGVAQSLATQINNTNWASIAPSVSVMASVSGSTITITAARSGMASVNGTAVTCSSGQVFTGLKAGDPILLGGTPYTVASVLSAMQLSLATAGPQGSVRYAAPLGGVDGNEITMYGCSAATLHGTNTLQLSATVLNFTGGSSAATWRVTLDFSAFGIDAIRQCWLTLAPALSVGGVGYSDTEWTATFANWTVADPLGKRPLKVAGPGSQRIGNNALRAPSKRVDYSGWWADPANKIASGSTSGWLQVANNYVAGFCSSTAVIGDSVSIDYACQEQHDLYLGTSLYSDRGIVAVSIDGAPAINLDCYLPVSAPLVTRRLVQPGVAAGEHSVTITLTAKNASSSGTNFYFDYLDAAVPSDVPDPTISYPNTTAALDYDTDHTYKVTPQRVVWGLGRLGLKAQVNLYLGVFWWNQRRRIGQVFNSLTIEFDDAHPGSLTEGDAVFIKIGGSANLSIQDGFVMGKTVFFEDTPSTVANHFAYFLNGSSVAYYASVANSAITMTQRAVTYSDSVYVEYVPTDVNNPRLVVKVNGLPLAANTVLTTSIAPGTYGTYIVDDSRLAQPINAGARAWLADFYAEVALAGLGCSTALSMELVNPPDLDPQSTKVYAAAFADGSKVLTDTGFHSLVSTQCAFTSSMLALQQATYAAIAAMEAAAGLQPWLQFGEFLWWFFSSMSQPLGYLAFTTPISIGVANPHGFSTGDRVVVAGAQGCDSANGTWTVTVTDATHFTLNSSMPSGAWVAGTGVVKGGSMAYYDTETAAAAQAALGRALYRFTCQDDDPATNSGADAAFLAGRLKAHVDAIRAYVLARVPNAKFELLYPNDVNLASCYYTDDEPYPQGGRLNYAVNFPPQWAAKTGSGLDRLKMEALSWGAQYRNLNLAEASITFPSSGGHSWGLADTAYLVPVFNGGCAWEREYQAAENASVPLIVLWAYDHVCLMSRKLPSPS